MANTIINGGASPYPKTVGPAAIASFSDGAQDAPLKSLTFNIEPVQDLHGYDYPWPAGGGKNLLLPYQRTVTASGVIYSVAADGKITLNGTATGSTSFTIWPSASGATVPTEGYYTVSLYGATNGKVNGATAATQSLAAGAIPSVFSITVTSGTAYNESFYVQIEQGRTATYYSPYSNICPISGWTQVKVTRTGKNILDHTLIENKGFDTDTGVRFNHPLRLSNIPIMVVGGKDLTVSINTGFYMATAMTYDKDGNYLGVLSIPWSVGPCVYHLPSNARYFTVNFKKTDDSACSPSELQVQIEYGSTATSYEPYQGKTYSVTFPTEAGTVYGGTLDVVRGKLNVKPYYASYSGQTLVGPWISSHDKYVAGATPTTGAQVVDMGAAGTDYDVTPKTIKTLLGTNNIWADAGEMSIEYVAVS